MPKKSRAAGWEGERSIEGLAPAAAQDVTTDGSIRG
jgi:hypothetical protein